MNNIAALIDKARQISGIGSDSALATHFGVHRQAVSKWRNGDAYPDEDHIVAMAQMAHDDPAAWLVAIKAQRSSGAAGRAWTDLAKRLGLAAGVVLAVAMPYAGGADAASISQKTPGLLIMFTRLGYRWRMARDLLLSRLRRKPAADTLEATLCL